MQTDTLRRRHSMRSSRAKWMPIGAPRIICPWGRSICATTRFCARPLALAHIKRMLLVGTGGTTPGQNFIYTHLNRAIKKYDLDMIYMSGPGHGGPAVVAGRYLEGTNSEIYANVGQDEAEVSNGCSTQFSFPGGIPSHASAECPGSIHEGGELGYSLSHAFGAVFDNPELVPWPASSATARTRNRTAGSRRGIRTNFSILRPMARSCPSCISQAGYKIANPTILARISREELDQLLRGYGWTPHYVEGHERDGVDAYEGDGGGARQRHRRDLGRIQADARTRAGSTERPRWPMIVLASPKGWTGPAKIRDAIGVPNEGTRLPGRIQVPLSRSGQSSNPEHLAAVGELAAQLSARRNCSAPMAG